MNAKISAFVICVEAIIYLLLYNLHDCTFKVRIFIRCTNFLNHCNFLNIVKKKKKKCYCWKTTAEWNIKVENILERRRTKIEKSDDENFQFFI